MQGLARTNVKFVKFQVSRTSRLVDRITSRARFVHRADIASNILSTIGNTALLGEEAHTKIISSLARQGIIKFREAQRLKSLDEVQISDLSWAVSYKRFTQAMNNLGKLTNSEIKSEPVKLGVVGTISNSVSDVIFGVRSSLREAQELTGKTSSPENDVAIAAKPARSRKAALGYMLALSASTLTACGISSITSSASSVALGTASFIGGLSTGGFVLLGVLGVVGFGLIYHLAKSPAFRDSAIRSLFPIATLTGSFYIRYLVVGALAASGFSGIPLWLMAAGAQWGTVIGITLLRNVAAHLLPFRVLGFGREASFLRQRSLLEDAKEHLAKRDLSYEFILSLRNKGKTFLELKQVAVDEVARCQGDQKAATEEIKEILDNARDENDALGKLEEYHVLHTGKVPDLRTPNLLLTTGSRVSRIFSWAYQIPILLAFTSGNFSVINAMLFTAFALCNIYYHIGTMWSMKLTEAGEHVENASLPEFQKDADGKESKPKIVTVRYSNKGLLNRNQIIPSFMISDIENRVLYVDNYYVVMNNDSPNHYTFETFGGVKIAQRIEARMHFMKERGLFDHVRDEETRKKLMFVLSCIDYDRNSMQVVDNAINLLYPNAPAGGAPMRFRDGYTKGLKRMKYTTTEDGKVVYFSTAIGDGGGENACYAALRTLLENDPYFKNGRESLKSKVEKGLRRLIIQENQLNLNGFQDSEKLASICQSLVDRFGVKPHERDEILDVFKKSKDDYLLETLHYTGVAAGMDFHRAHGIAYEIVKGSKEAVRWSKIAPLADRVLIGLGLTAQEEASFKELVKDAFGVDGERTLNALRNNPIERNAQELIETPDVEPSLFYKIWRYAQVALAIQRKGPKTEEGNMRRRLEYYIEKREKSSLTPAEEEELQFLSKTLGFDIDKFDVNEVLTDKNNSHCGFLIARQIQAVLINRGWLSGGFLRRLKLDDLSRTIGLAIAKAAAPLQPTMADYVREAQNNPGAFIEAINRKVWERFIQQLGDRIPDAINEALRSCKVKLPPLKGKEHKALIELATEVAKTEFTNNKNEIFRTAMGLAHTFTHDIRGLEELERIFENAAELEDLYQLRSRCGQIKDRKDKALQTLRDLLRGSPEETNATLEQLEKDIKTLMDTGVGALPTTKGYNLLYRKLIGLLPHVVVGDGQVKIKKGEWSGIKTLVISDPKRDGVESVKKVRFLKEHESLLKEAIEELVYADAEARRVKKDLQIWTSAQLDETRGQDGIVGRETAERENEELLRVVSEPTSSKAADFIVDELIKNPNGQVRLAENAPKILDSMVVEYTGGKGLAPEERNEILKEIADKNIRLQQADSSLRDSFDSVYRFSRVWGFRWGKQLAKANNTNREILGTRVYEQVGTHLRHIVKLFFTEKLGFHRIPVFLSEKIKLEVTDLLRFYVDANKDLKFKLDNGLTQDDIGRQLLAEIKGGRTSEVAAEIIWKKIKNLLNGPDGKKREKIIRDYNRVGRLESIRLNLHDCASEAAILHYGAKLVELLHGGNPGQAFAELKRLRKENKVTILQGKQLRKIIIEEHGRINADEHLLKSILKARGAGNIELAMELEQRLRYKDDDNSTYSSYYRHKTKRPELVLGRSRKLKELAVWLNSTQKAVDYSVESGELLEDAKLLRRCAEIGDELLDNITGKTNAQIKSDYGITENIDADLNLLRSAPAERDARRLNSFSEAEGKALEERSEAFIRVLSAVLQAREIAEKKDPDKDQNDLRVLNLNMPLVNCLDHKRFPKTALEELKGEVQMNADTDNIFYQELLNAAGYFGHLWGLFARPNEIVQYGLNYEIPFRSPFCRFQRDRDLGGPQNQSAARAALAPFGKVRWRSALIEFTGTLTGYANFLPVHVALQSTEYTMEVNNVETAYRGQKTFEKVFGKKWWEKSNKGKLKTRRERLFYYHILNRNFVNQLMGWENGWDASMAVERWLRIIPTVAIAGMVFGKVINYAFGSVFGGSTDFEPSPINAFGQQIGLGTIALASLGLWSFAKAIAWVFGRSVDCHQYFRSRRIYIIDPSEDLATTLPLRIKGFRLTLAKGLRQMNDAMIEYEGDMGQKLRWQAQNAGNIWRVLSYIWDYRKALTVKESFDLLQGPLYNMFGLPGTFNRWAILLFIFLSEPSILMNKLAGSLENSLGWIVELGFLNYFSIEGMLRLSRMHQGSSWKGAGSNFGYETTMLGFNYMNVMRRAVSKAKFGFNVTDPPEEPCITGSTPWHKPWQKGWMRTRLDGAPGFLFRNRVMMVLEGYALARLGLNHLTEAVGLGDFWGIYMGTLLFWVGSRVYYNLKGHALNTGISRIPGEEEWEKKNKVWEPGWGLQFAAAGG